MNDYNDFEILIANKKSKNKNLKLFLFVIVSFAVLCSKLPTLALFYCMFGLFNIIRIGKFSIFSLIALLLNYCAILEYFAFKGIYTYGLLNMNIVEVYYWDYIVCCFTLNIIIIYILKNTNALKKEKNYYLLNYNISKTLVKLLCLLAVIITVLIFPKLPGVYGNKNRFSSGIIPFTGWSCIPFFFLAICIFSKHHKKIVYACTGFVCAWYVLHGERVDALGMIAFCVYRYMNCNTRKNNVKKLIKVFVCGMALMMILTLVGLKRGGSDDSLKMILLNLIIQSTACDVTHTFNCAVDLWNETGGYGGKTYLSYLINCIPMLRDDYSFQKIIASDYTTAGGGNFFAEPYANGGLIFTIFVILAFLIIVLQIIKCNNRYFAFIYLEVFLSMFRLCWYGLNYPIITIIYFVPFVIVLNNIMRTNKTKNNKYFKRIVLEE